MFDSGDGDDTLEFDRSNLEIGLTVLDSGGIQNIERLDIDGSGSNNLRLRSDDFSGVCHHQRTGAAITQPGGKFWYRMREYDDCSRIHV